MRSTAKAWVDVSAEEPPDPDAMPIAFPKTVSGSRVTVTVALQRTWVALESRSVQPPSPSGRWWV